MKLEAVKTDIFKRDQDLNQFVIEATSSFFPKENVIVAVTSKIVSLAENCTVDLKSVSTKLDLVKKESDVFLGEIGYGCSLTIKHGLFIPSAGIDESNAEGEYYITYPKNPYHSAKKIWEALRGHYKIKNLGVLITDSHTFPLRKGVTGICLAHWGFEGLKIKVGCEDLFGRKLKMTNVNAADALAAAIVYLMGEGNEQTPLGWIEDAKVNFVLESSPQELSIPMKEDLYYPLYKALLDDRQ